MPREGRCTNFIPLSEFARGHIIRLREAGMPLREFADCVNRNKATVMRCRRAWFEGGRTRRVKGTTLQSCTADHQDH